MSFLKKGFDLVKVNLRNMNYLQGQVMESNIREYFYYVDHQGMLFLDDTKIKNFTSCYKDKVFLGFFFTGLQVNNTGKYTNTFPYISKCGREQNFLRCDDRPIVYLQLKELNGNFVLIYAFNDSKLFFNFSPQDLFMHPQLMRVYHPAPFNCSGIGLIKSSLAMELANCFRWEHGKSGSDLPASFVWNNKSYNLSNSLLDKFNSEPRHMRGVHYKSIEKE